MRGIVPLVLLMVACSPARRDDDRPGNDRDPVDAGSEVTACTSDSECEALGLVCDLEGGRCICTRDSMCDGDASRPWCLRGACSAAQCVSSVDCEGGLRCLGEPKRCLDGLDTCEACTENADCKSGSSCREQPGRAGSGRFCAPSCDGGCPAGFSCQDGACFPANGTCDEPGTSCVPDSEAACSSPSACGDGLVCDAFFARCYAAQTICEPGLVCDPQTYSCVAACEGDDECGADERCSSGRCVAVSGRPSGCQNNDDCPLGERCVQEPSSACVPGCGSDSDCSLAAVCVSGQCRSRDLQGAQQCQVKEACGFRENCVGDACTEDLKHCQPCGGGCGAGGQCQSVFFSVTCGDGTGLTCPAGSLKKCGLYTNTCTACACQVNRCLHSCTTDSNCPNGFSCAPYGAAGSVCAPLDAAQCL